MSGNSAEPIRWLERNSLKIQKKEKTVHIPRKYNRDESNNGEDYVEDMNENIGTFVHIFNTDDIDNIDDLPKTELTREDIDRMLSELED